MSGTKILVVDDDVELRDLLREYLTQQGFAVSVLPDGDGLRGIGISIDKGAMVVVFSCRRGARAVSGRADDRFGPRIGL